MKAMLIFTPRDNLQDKLDFFFHLSNIKVGEPRAQEKSEAAISTSHRQMCFLFSPPAFALPFLPSHSPVTLLPDTPRWEEKRLNDALS